MSREALDNLVNGRAGVTPEMAVRLAAAFGGRPRAWRYGPAMAVREVRCAVGRGAFESRA